MILLIPIVVGFLAVLLTHFGNKVRNRHGDSYSGTKFELWCYNHESPLSGVVSFSFIILLAMLMGLAIVHIGYAAFPSEYKALETTLNISRDDKNASIERAAVMHKVIDMNKEIASARYWDDIIWTGIFIPDRVAKLEFIK